MGLKLFACGDVVNFKGKKDFISDDLKSIIRTSDIAICNFEAPVEHSNMQKIKKAGPYLYQSRESVKYLKDSGFNFVSLANNHIYDYGQRGIEETICELQKTGIDFIGGGINFDEAYKTKIIEKNGIKLGLLAGCENEFGCLYEEKNRGGYAWLLHPKIEDNILYLKASCDFVVLVAHAGVENIEIPIKEWRDIYKRFCDLGVNVIIGHHPHVPQGFEKYNGNLIFYSLGNFYFDSLYFNNQGDDSYSIVLSFEKKQNQKEINFEIVYHKKIKGQTSLVEKEDVNFDIDVLCNLLESNYQEKNNKLCIKLFYEYYLHYYEFALDSFPRNSTLLRKLKWLIKKLLPFDYKSNDRYLMLLHNIRIDSHRFLVQRALSLLVEEE